MASYNMDDSKVEVMEIHQYWHRFVEPGKGIGIDKIFTQYDEKTKCPYGIISYETDSDGYVVFGVNLDGMFNSVYVPEGKVEDLRIYDGDGNFGTRRMKVPEHWYINKMDDAIKCSDFLDDLHKERFYII